MSACGLVTKAIRQYGYYRQAEAMQSLPADVSAVVSSMGWQTLCASENEMTDRAHFIKAYDAMQRRDRQITKVGHLIGKEMERLT